MFIQRYYIPEDSVIIFHHWFNSVPKVIDGFGDIQCGKRRYNEQPDGRIDEMFSRALTSERAMNKKSQTIDRQPNEKWIR